jgi:hypothetical protein
MRIWLHLHHVEINNIQFQDCNLVGVGVGAVLVESMAGGCLRKNKQN